MTGHVEAQLQFCSCMKSVKRQSNQTGVMVVVAIQMLACKEKIQEKFMLQHSCGKSISSNVK